MKTLSFIFLILSFYLSGCANYIKKMHRELDEGLGHSPSARSSKRDAISFYRDKKMRPSPARLSTKNKRNLDPKVKRYYKPAHKKRYTADDLVDNANAGSLWSGQGQRNFLFSKNKIIKNGDIIVIHVEKILKKEISMELHKAFPTRKMASKKKKGAEEAAPKPADTNANDSDTKSQIFDKISSVVVEEINKDYLLLRGRKDVIFKKAKRLIEVEVLVARRDVTNDDTVLSSSTLEKNVNVLR